MSKETPIERSKAHRCPYCESSHIDATSQLQHDTEGIWQKVRCITCEHEWKDVYDVVKVELIS